MGRRKASQFSAPARSRFGGGTGGLSCRSLAKAGIDAAKFPAQTGGVPVATGKEHFFAKLEALIAEARRLQARGFDEQEPEEATKQSLIEPFFHALAFSAKTNYTREFKILEDSVDYLLKSERPLMFVEAKSLLDCPRTSLFDKHREQVHRYIQNYRLSPEITAMEQPVKWILLANFAQFHFIRVNEVTPSFSFKLDDLWKRREELWELLALENLEANRIDELYDQHKQGRPRPTCFSPTSNAGGCSSPMALP